MASLWRLSRLAHGRLCQCHQDSCETTRPSSALLHGRASPQGAGCQRHPGVLCSDMPSCRIASHPQNRTTLDIQIGYPRSLNPWIQRVALIPRPFEACRVAGAASQKLGTLLPEQGAG